MTARSRVAVGNKKRMVDKLTQVIQVGTRFYVCYGSNNNVFNSKQ